MINSQISSLNPQWIKSGSVQANGLRMLFGTRVMDAKQRLVRRWAARRGLVAVAGRWKSFDRVGHESTGVTCHICYSTRLFHSHDGNLLCGGCQYWRGYMPFEVIG